MVVSQMNQFTEKNTLFNHMSKTSENAAKKISLCFLFATSGLNPHKFQWK